jgi:hypothetical protein
VFYYVKYRVFINAQMIFVDSVFDADI